MRYAVLGLCLFATACAGGDPSAPTAPSSPPSDVGLTEARSGSGLPFRGTLEASEVHTGAFPVLHSVLTGTGQATHSVDNGRVCIRHHDRCDGAVNNDRDLYAHSGQRR